MAHWYEIGNILMHRLGFAVRIIGRGAPSLNGNQRDLSAGLAILPGIVGYLRRQKIACYRMGDPFGQAGPSHAQLAACTNQLDLLANDVAAAGLRLSIHLAPALPLDGTDEDQAAQAFAEIACYAALLDALEAACAPATRNAVLVAHAHNSQRDGLARLAARIAAAPLAVQQRLVIEHVPSGPSLRQLLGLHQACGVPIVFDSLHWALDRRERLPFALALGLTVATWPAPRRAKVHLSSARSEARLGEDARGNPRIFAPRPGQHADFVRLEDARALFAAARGLPAFDIMLEAKASDLALLQLRDELAADSDHAIIPTRF